MAGRPRTMARRVRQLYERYSAVSEELQKLMPKQYLKPTNDYIGDAWQRAVRSVSDAALYFEDLADFLEYKAAEAEERAKASQGARDIALGDLDRDEG